MRPPQVETAVERTQTVEIALSLVALMGPSGSGKSTLLSIMGLLLRPSAGALSIAGERVDALTDSERAAFRNRRLGFVFQFHHLLIVRTIAPIGSPAARSSAWPSHARS